MVYKYKFNIVEKVDGNSKHHLFDYPEIRINLIKLFGEPITDEDHITLHKRCKICMDEIPVFVIEKKRHEEYHKKEWAKRSMEKGKILQELDKSGNV